MILAQASRAAFACTALGIVIGIGVAGALLLTRILTTLLFGVTTPTARR